MRTLLIEQNTELAKNINDMLVDAGYVCDVVESLKQGDYYFDIRNYDLVIVDWSLIDGSDFLQTAPFKQADSLIIVLSELVDNKTEITALREGADDYIRKPFDLAVLHARIDAGLRRNGNIQSIEIGDLKINTEEVTVSYGDININIKGKPFEVFAHLALHRNQIMSKEQLLDALWVDPELVTPNVIDVAVNQIRKKVDQPFGITTIETVSRRGYRFCYPG